MNMQLTKFVVPHGASMREALSIIESNKHGIILTIEVGGCVVGLATDGDIRRKLLEGVSLDEPIGLCANQNFIWESPSTSRELLMKKLDHRIRVIPILNSDRRLIGIVSRDNLPIQTEEAVYARARAPVRISFGGGGSDLTQYFADQNGAVINTTISLYSHATLRLRNDRKIIISSHDLDDTIQADDLESILDLNGRFGLIQALLKVVRPDFGFELFLHSDYPMNSGLGGSAAISAAVLGCFNQFRLDQWDQHELAELAFQAERFYLGVSGGWQDQYATVFGGFNFMEFRMDQNIVHPLRIHNDTLLELEESLILCDTGLAHDSGGIHDDQREQMHQKAIMQKIQSNVDLTYQIRNHLLRGRLLQFGQALDDAWQIKRQLSTKISTVQLDEIYNDALKHGAIGGKLLGAGGGGFFLFYVPPFRKFELMKHLSAQAIKPRPFRFEHQGLLAWKMRELQNQ